MRRGGARGGKQQRFAEERKFSNNTQHSEKNSQIFRSGADKKAFGSKNRQNNLHFQMEQKSKLEDLENMRFLSEAEKKELKQLEIQLAGLEEPKPARDEF